MANFAVGNPCTNIIVAESLEIAEEVTGRICYEYTDENPAGIGWTLNEKTGKWSNPTEVTW